MELEFPECDVKKAVEFLVSLAEKVTCSECCCMYVIPTGTAECGHCLCKTCWIGRTHCPECNLKVNKSKLKYNETLSEMQKCVDRIIQSFESVFGIDVDEAFLTLQDNKKTTKKPTSRVEDWLKNSQNKFSSILTQDSTQEIEPAIKVVSKVQIHESNTKKTKPVKIQAIPNPLQEDWDKIEVVADTENDERENILGPMDIEPFELDDEYTSKKPRRSLRKRQNSISDNSKENKNNKNSPAESSTPDKKLDKFKQNWTEVKKMKKEFSKLGKSKPKLNVSIEKCKRSNSKQTSIVQFSVSNESQENMVIDENTPNVVNIITDSSTEVSTEVKQSKGVIEPVANESSISKEKSGIENEKELSLSEKNPIKFVKKSVLSQKNLDKEDSESHKLTDRNISDPTTSKNLKGPSNMNIQTNNSNSLKNSISFNDDSVHITIKFRGVETYINIKTDDTTNDQEVQTNPVTVIHKKVAEPSSVVPAQTQTATEHNSQKCKSAPMSEKVMCSVGVQTHATPLKETNGRLQTHESKEKSSKKNTDSADTATYEITETIAKELSVIMECDENDMLSESKIERTKTRSSQKPKTQPKSRHKSKDTLQEVEIDDNDIFNSGSLKDKPVHKLKDAIDTQSEILMTHKTTRSKTRNTDKRQRDTSDEGRSGTKRQKMTQDILIQNTSGTNYDELMGHIFTNIDAEMQKSNEKLDKIDDPKYSENIFSLAEKESEELMVPEKNKTVPTEMTQEDIDNLLTPGMCEDLAEDVQIQPPRDKGQQGEVECTPIIEDDDHSIVEETPQKTVSFTKPKSRDSKSSGDGRKRPQSDKADSDSLAVVSLDSRKDSRQTLDSPMTITRFVDQIQHNSTPVARKALDFNKNTETYDDNVTLCPSLTLAKTTQEKAMITEVFDQQSQVRKPSSPKNVAVRKPCCIAGSCLKPNELAQLKILCHKKTWNFADKYSDALTHLIVGVDEEKRSQRSVKYMCALAAGCWILSPQWLKKCLETNSIVKEEPFEVLDSNGEPGPRRSRLAKSKIFSGFTFYCLPPFNVLDTDTLKCILELSGARVVNEIKALKDSCSPAFLLAEPDNTEDSKYMYMAVDLHIVPINFEWVLNCLGSYNLLSVTSLLLCPNTMLPKTIQYWPRELFVEDDLDY